MNNLRILIFKHENNLQCPSFFKLPRASSHKGGHRPGTTVPIPGRLIRPRWAKHSRQFSELNRLLPFFVARHCTCHHLTQSAVLALIHHGTGSMSFYGDVAGTGLEGWLNSQRSRSTYFAHLWCTYRNLYV